MKKIILLLAAAVFAIGIQSCSTEEEEVLLEENLATEEKLDPSAQQKSSIGLGLPKYTPDYMYVFFSESMTDDNRTELRNLMKKDVYSSLLIALNKSCFNREAWDITNYDPTLFKKSGFATLPEGRLIADAETKDDEDDDNDGDAIIPFPLNTQVKLFSIENIGNYRVKLYYSDEVPAPCPGEDPILLN